MSAEARDSGKEEHLERLTGEVGRQLRRLGPGPALGEVSRAWQDAVGPAVAIHAQPVRLGRDGTLHVHTSSSVWAFELSQMGDLILGRLRRHMASEPPRRLRFVPGLLPESSPAVGGEGEARRLPPEPQAVEEARRLAAGVESRALADSIVRAAAYALAQARSDRAV